LPKSYSVWATRQTGIPRPGQRNFLEKILKQLGVVLAVALLAGCGGGTPYKQPSASNNSAELVIESHDELTTIDVYGDQNCSPAGAQGRLAEGTLARKTARINAGERVYLRISGRTSPDIKRVYYLCKYLVSFVPEPNKSYRLWPNSGSHCVLDMFEGETYFPPKSLQRYTVPEGCTSSWE
jgi:hypothetical protein